MIIASRRAVLAGLAMSPCAAAMPALAADDRAARAEAALNAVFAEYGPPAMTAAVIGPQGLIWSGVRGVRRAGGDEAVGPDALWHLGSNGKAMTAVLYARLVDQGRARWGATVAELFAGQAVDPALVPVTIDDLLNHRSGLTDAELMGRDWLIAAHRDARPTRSTVRGRRAISSATPGVPAPTPQPSKPPGAGRFSRNTMRRKP